MTDVQPIFDGDQRIDTLVDRLDNVIDSSRDAGLTAAAVVGAIEIVKQKLLKELLND